MEIEFTNTVNFRLFLVFVFGWHWKFTHFEICKKVKKFAHKLSENELTVSIPNKDENAITLGKNANPTFSKLITRSDDIQIDSVRKSIKLATDINKEEEKEE